MPIYSEVSQQIREAYLRIGEKAFDVVRRRYLAEYVRYTGRSVILYAASPARRHTDPWPLYISDEDMPGWMQAVHGIVNAPDAERGLDVILLSPGGSAEATEATVNYLRSHFKHIRAVIPRSAMSAATMLACACDEIVMGTYSWLGPTDLQFHLTTPVGYRITAARDILDQWRRAVKDCADPAAARAWAPLLPQYGPALLSECRNAKGLSVSLVAEWLAKYMFAGQPNAAARAKTISRKLATHDNHLSHGRHLPMRVAKEYGLRVVTLDEDAEWEDITLSILHAATVMFEHSPVLKIIENHQGPTYSRVDPADHTDGPLIVPMPEP